MSNLNKAITQSLLIGATCAAAIAAAGCTAPTDLEAGPAPATTADEIVGGTATTLRPEIGLFRGCTATLIAPRFVLTAAHCVDKVNWTNEAVSASDAFSVEAADGVTRSYSVRGIRSFASRDWDHVPGSTMTADVAIVLLATPVPEGIARPAVLADALPKAGAPVSTFGYGCTDRGTKGGYGTKRTISFTYGSKTTALCSGDSGGPLVNDSDGTIWGVNTGYSSGGSDVFADVTYFRDRILALTRSWGHTAKIGVFNQGLWSVDQNRTHAWEDEIDSRFTFGSPGDAPVIAGEGHMLGVFHNGLWSFDFDYNGKWTEGGDRRFNYGSPGDTPIVGYLAGRDAASRLAVFNPKTALWSVDMNGNGQADSGDVRYTFGIQGDMPVAGNWVGSLRSDRDKIGVFNNGTWSVDINANGAWDEGVDTRFTFGSAGDLPVVGDWDGDGRDNLGVFNPKSGVWSLDMDGNGQWNASDARFTFGSPGDIPVITDR